MRICVLFCTIYTIISNAVAVIYLFASARFIRLCEPIRLNNHFFCSARLHSRSISRKYRSRIRFTSFQKLANRILLWFTKISKFAAKDKGSRRTSRLREQCGSIKGDLKLNIVLAHGHAMSRMGSIRKFQALSAKKLRVVQSGCARGKSTENRFHKRDVTL